MKRREFLAATGMAALAAPAGSMAFAQNSNPSQQFLEWREYRLLNTSKQNTVHDFLKNAAIPAWNRMGVKPVGVFSVIYGPTNPTIYVLLPHSSLESFATVDERLLADQEAQKMAADFINVRLSDPSFVRMQKSLLQAFTHMPKVEAPETAADNKPRIFELRIYESHSEKAGFKKIEMFNEGGEIAIFRKTGLTPVFFARTIAGPQMPNLQYMLTFADMQERDKAWKTFVDSPEWKELSAKEEYKDTVSNITDIILRPAPYSQI